MNKVIPAVIVIVARVATAFAQGSTPPAADFSSKTREVYASVKDNLMHAAEAMPESGYSFRPVPEEMTFGEWVAHIAMSQTGYCSTLGGEMKRGDAASKRSKADLVAALKSSFDVCDPYYNGLKDGNVLEMVSVGTQKMSRGWVLSYNLAHDNECYGSMAVYLRIKGIVPPSTAARNAAMGGRGR